MQWKVIGWILGIVLALGLIGGLIYNQVKTTEKYQGKEQTFHSPNNTFYPLSLGCASYRVMADKAK